MKASCGSGSWGKPKPRGNRSPSTYCTSTRPPGKIGRSKCKSPRGSPGSGGRVRPSAPATRCAGCGNPKATTSNDRNALVPTDMVEVVTSFAYVFMRRRDLCNICHNLYTHPYTRPQAHNDIRQTYV